METSVGNASELKYYEMFSSWHRISERHPYLRFFKKDMEACSRQFIIVFRYPDQYVEAHVIEAPSGLYATSITTVGKVYAGKKEEAIRTHLSSDEIYDIDADKEIVAVDGGPSIVTNDGKKSIVTNDGKNTIATNEESKKSITNLPNYYEISKKRKTKENEFSCIFSS